MRPRSGPGGGFDSVPPLFGQGGSSRLPTISHMKCLTLMGLALIAPLAAQDQPDPHKQLEAKLASPFLRHASWTTDFDAALRRATELDQLVLGYFTTTGP